MLVAVCVAWACDVSAEDRFSVFFVAVGSEDYVSVDADALRDFPRIRGVNRSAKRIANILQAGGAEYGILLTSTPGAFVGVTDVMTALNDVIERVERSKSRNPLIIVYLAGHGISEGIGWHQFSVPGNLVIEYKDLNFLDIEALSKRAISPGNVSDLLEEAGLAHLVIVDTCYEGTAVSFETPVLSETAIQNLSATAAILRFMNEFRQTDPILFSTEPGTLVSTVVDPRSTGGTKSIAPLARRLTLIADQAAGQRTLSLRAVVQKMSDPSLDRLTRPAVTHAVPDAIWDRVLLGKISEVGGEIEFRVGTAIDSTLCCPVEEGSVDKDDGLSPTSFTGTLQIFGSADDFISAGQDVSLDPADSEFTVIADVPGKLSITIETSDTWWSIDVATPDGEPFVERNYSNAERMSHGGSPEIDIGGDGRGCNETLGGFEVTDVAYDDTGELLHFAASFEQYCDDGTTPMRGRVSVFR